MGLKTNIIAKDALITKEITRILGVLCQELWAETNMEYFLIISQSEFIHVVMWVSEFLFFVRVSNISLRICHILLLLILLLIGHLEFFHLVAVVNSAALNVDV